MKIDESGQKWMKVHESWWKLIKWMILHPALQGAKPAAAKPAAAKPAASKADYSRPWQTKAFWYPRCYQHLRSPAFIQTEDATLLRNNCPGNNSCTTWHKSILGFSRCSTFLMLVLIMMMLTQSRFELQNEVRNWLDHFCAHDAWKE